MSLGSDRLNKSNGHQTSKDLVFTGLSSLQSQTLGLSGGRGWDTPCYRLKGFPSDSHAKVLTLVPQSGTVFSNGVFKEGIKLNGGPNPGQLMSLSEEEMSTHAEERPCEDPGTRRHLHAKDGDFSVTQPCWHFDLALLASRM